MLTFWFRSTGVCLYKQTGRADAVLTSPRIRKMGDMIIRVPHFPARITDPFSSFAVPRLGACWFVRPCYFWFFRSLYIWNAFSGVSFLCTTAPTAWIIALGASDWKMFRPISTPLAPCWIAL